MTPEEKQDRLKELSKPNSILSDQEIEEKERLEEELKIIYREETQQFTETKINLGKGDIVIPKKKNLFDIVKNIIKKKPVTFEQIEKLKNERTIAYLKRDIAKANYDRKNPGGKPKQSKQSNSKNAEIEREFGSSTKQFRDMAGTNNASKYKGLI